jgi:2-amino-4-hydroxy-6-hydroxymethyldihydropteridine diphosphokinase
MTEREFVLRPLADIAPEWKHPQTNLTVAEMLARLPDGGAHRIADKP